MEEVKKLFEKSYSQFESRLSSTEEKLVTDLIFLYYMGRIKMISYPLDLEKSL